MDTDLNVSLALISRHSCKVDIPNKVPYGESITAPYSMSGHDHEMTMANDGYGGDMYDDGQGNDTQMTRLQIFVGRTIGGWPLYAIIISIGQLVSAVSGLIDPHSTLLISDLLPTQSARWKQHANRTRPVHHLFDLRRCYARLVHSVPNEAICICLILTLALVSSMHVNVSLLRVASPVPSSSSVSHPSEVSSRDQERPLLESLRISTLSPRPPVSCSSVSTLVKKLEQQRKYGLPERALSKVCNRSGSPLCGTGVTH